jgi:hypothetical protein
VTLQRKAGRSFTAIGTGKTDGAGNWKVGTDPQGNAQYKAVVASKSLSGRDKCGEGSSKTLTARATTSSIAIGATGDSFKGKLTSGAPDCVNGRTVKLARKSPGQNRFTTVGSPDTVSGDGNWEVGTDPVDNGQYRGTVSARTVGSNACMAATSAITTARESTVTIQQGGSLNFNGMVNSVPACKSGRTVTLQRRGEYDPAFEDVDSRGTALSGTWTIPTEVLSDLQYRASVSPRQASANSCLGGLSPVVIAT